MEDGPRVLYSFGHKMGAGRVCWTAWQQVLGLRDAGVRVTAMVGGLVLAKPHGVRLKTTLSAGPLRMPYRFVGVRRALAVHDHLTARWLDAHWREVDIVHGWALGALKTFQVARKRGIPTLLERQNCHTAHTWRVVAEECRRLGVVLPQGFEHTYDAVALARELREYDAADYLLCPSDVVASTFVAAGFDHRRLLRHRYGYDSARIVPGAQAPLARRPLVTLYAGIGSPRKGLHHALQAWLNSCVSRNGGRFLICGALVEPYREYLGELLSQPGVEVLGPRCDVPELMRQADLFVLSSLEEGSALVTYEARGAGCVLMVSDVSGAVCTHLKDGMVHRAGDAAALTRHFDAVERDRGLLQALRNRSLEGLSGITWRAAGGHLADIYRQGLAVHRRDPSPNRRSM